MSGEAQELEQIARWFADRGFALRFTRDDGHLVWADLARLSSGNVVAPLFGRGESEIEAARRARQRYEQEQ